MKYLLIILTVFLVSCEEVKRDSIENSNLVIKEIGIGWSDNPKIVKYRLNNSLDNRNFDFDYFYDSVGKYNVGDTIKLMKK